MTIFGLTFIEFLGYAYLGILCSNVAEWITHHPWWNRGPKNGRTAKEAQMDWDI